MKAGASARWWIAWIDPINPTTMVGPVPFTVRTFTPAPSRGSLSFTGTMPLVGVAPGFSEDSIPTIATTFALWREGSTAARAPRKRFTSSRATIYRREPMGTSVLLTLDFPEYVAADEDEGRAVGEWLRGQIEAAADAAFRAREGDRASGRVASSTVKPPKIAKGGARGLLDAMSAEPTKKPDDEKAPPIIPKGARRTDSISYVTPPPSPAPAGCIWIDGANVWVSIGGGWWIQQGSMTVMGGARMGKA